jgi:hypothetical protein
MGGKWAGTTGTGQLGRFLVIAWMITVSLNGRSILEIGSVEAVIQWVNSRPRPLGLYVFAEDLAIAERIIDATESGDAAINDCTIHPLIPELPFGGVGNSGMGKYHGRWGFEAFTNARGVLYHSSRIDPGVRYPPYSKHSVEREIEAKLMP